MESIVTVFRSRLRDEVDGYHETADEMERLARAMPGFVGFKQFTADDGERLALVEFDTAEHQSDWRNHPDHRVAQRRGREEWYAEYRIQVCTVMWEHTFGG